MLMVLGLIDPAIAMPWSREKSRKKAVMFYGFVFFITLALNIIFFPMTNLESKVYALFFFCLMLLAVGLISPRVVLPWSRSPSKAAVAMFYLPPTLILIGAMVYAGAANPVDPRYDVPGGDLAGVDPVTAIKYLAAAELRGDNNIGLERVHKIDVSEAPGGGYEVKVEYNIEDVLMKDLFKLKADSDMTHVYKAVYTGGYDVKNATITAYYPVGDRASRPPPVPIYTTSLDGEAAHKVDWQRNMFELESEVLPKLWKVEYAHQDFK